MYSGSLSAVSAGLTGASSTKGWGCLLSVCVWRGAGTSCFLSQVSGQHVCEEGSPRPRAHLHLSPAGFTLAPHSHCEPLFCFENKASVCAGDSGDPRGLCFPGGTLWDGGE